jgi:general secretion pathway protein K
VIHSRQRGIALLVAIIMFALCTTVAAAITYNKAMSARRAAATFTMEQALQAGMAAESLASIAIEDASGSGTINLDQDWAQPLGPLEIEGTGVWIQAQVEDISGRFNLNSLVQYDQQTNSFVEDPHQVAVFKQLLTALNMDLRWADLMVDWIDTDIAPNGNAGGGGEDTLYLSQNPPYRPPNTFITHASELLALPGFGAENYAKLAPYVSALPIDAKVNVCTALGYVLDATLLDPQNPTQWQLQDMSALRKGNGCRPSAPTFTAPHSDPAVKSQVEARIGEKSNWFRLRTNIRVGTAEFVLYSVLCLEGTNKVRAVQRSFGSE